MRKKLLRYAAGALGLALATSAAAISFDTTAAAGVPAPIAVNSWTRAVSQLPEMTKVVHDRQVIALANAKLELTAVVRTAGDLFDSSKGKATDASRAQLAVERNRAYSMVRLTDDPAEPPVEQEQLNAAIETVNGEVAAWEEAEAKRIAEEARVAEEARIAAEASKATAARTSGRSVSSSAAQASGQGAQQYLEGIAAANGGSISWAAAPCGRGGGSVVSGCYGGGSTVSISTSAYGSWGTAKGSGRNVLLHELSHMKIKATCGTVKVGGARFENVTDAYAVLIGASAGTGYGYNDNDVAIARAALGGQCL